jgi:lysophospholipase L1-like esterase
LRSLTAKLSLALLVSIVSVEIFLQAAAWFTRREIGGTDRAPRTSGITILCVGDSHTWGAGVVPDQSYPAQLEAALVKRYPERDVRALNLGRPGVNSAYVATRLEAQILRHQPALVIVWVGTNNVWNNLEALDAADSSLAAELHELLLHAKLYRLAVVLWHTSTASDPLPLHAPDAQLADRHEAYQEWVAAGQERSVEAIERSLRRDMRAMVESAKSLDTSILFVTYPQKSQKLPVSLIIEEVATDLGAPVVVTARDRGRALADGLRDLQLFVFTAGPHPSARMYGYVVESMLPHAIEAIDGTSTISQ